MNKIEYFDEYFEIGDATVFVRKSDSGCEVVVFPEKDKDDMFTFNLDRETLKLISDTVIDFLGGWSFVDSMSK